MFMKQDGVEVFVKCMTGTQASYGEFPDTNAHSTSDEQICIIDVTDGERFAVHVKLDRTFDFGEASHVQILVDIDDRVAEWDRVLSEKAIRQNPTTVINKFRWLDGDQWTQSAMTFERLFDSLTATQETVAHIGTIRVSVTKGVAEYREYNNWTPTRKVTDIYSAELAEAEVKLFARPARECSKAVEPPARPQVLRPSRQDTPFEFVFKYQYPVPIGESDTEESTTTTQEEAEEAQPSIDGTYGLRSSIRSQTSKAALPTRQKPSTKQVLVSSPETSRTVQLSPVSTMMAGSLGGDAPRKDINTALPMHKKLKMVESSRDGSSEDNNFAGPEALEGDWGSFDSSELDSMPLLERLKAAQSNQGDALVTSSIPGLMRTSFRSNAKAVVIDLHDSSPESSPAHAVVQSFVKSAVQTAEGAAAGAEEYRSVREMTDEELRNELRSLEILQELQRRKNK